MKQVFRRVKDKKGIVLVEELPAPQVADNQVLVQTEYTVISAGTEGATLSKTFPELVKQTLQDPWMREAVKNLIFGASPILTKNIVWDETTLMRAIGYSGAGTVIDVGKNVNGISVGSKVAFAAEGHAAVVAPSKNFVVPIPENVSTQEAAFVTLGGIALQGVRRAQIQIGENVVVYGMGLVGLLTAQIVRAAGGKVIGVDISDAPLALLKKLVPDARTINASELDLLPVVKGMTEGYGADAVIICASSKDKCIANNAMKMARKQGKVVFVGLVKMDLERMPFFQNELDLKFSRAYGPGVMEPNYEKGRVDYPFHYVRWTEQRNLGAFLDLVASGKVDVKSLTAGIYAVDDAQKAFHDLYQPEFRSRSVLLHYTSENGESSHNTVNFKKNQAKTKNSTYRIGLIGCGNFTRTTHIPNLNSHKSFDIGAIASKTGVNAVSIVDRFKIPQSTTDYRVVIDNNDIDAVVVATRHDMHCQIACEALAQGKHVFMEKPAVLNFEQYQQLKQAIDDSQAVFMVGYNRRYSSLGIRLKEMLQPNLPMIIQYNVAIPEVPSDHWTLDSHEGGGRLIGEAEHFFDFMNFLAEVPVSHIGARCLTRQSETSQNQFNFAVDLTYGNSALATLTYTSLAAATKLPREQVIVHQAGRTLIVNDFKSLQCLQAQKQKKQNKLFAEMGHKREVDAFANLLESGETPSSDVALAASYIALKAQSILDEGQS